MNRLIFFRHGKAERSAPGGDAERRLTDRGRHDAALMGRVLAEKGFVPDLALVSGATRTRETWAAAQPSFPKARAEVRRDLYLAAETLIWSLAETLGETAGTVMVVGHNPGLQYLVMALMRQGGEDMALRARAEARFATASVAVFDFDETGRPACAALLHASDFGGGAGE